MTISILAIDIAQNTFQFYGVDSSGNTVYKNAWRVASCLPTWPICQLALL